MTLSNANNRPNWSGSAKHLPVEELARRQGIEPLRSAGDLAMPGLIDDEEHAAFPGRPVRLASSGSGVSFVVLDTGRLSARLASQTACITFVTLGELTKRTAIRSWGPQRRSQRDEWRRRLVPLPFDEEVTVIWGELQARARQRGNDTWIAACCLANELPLATSNTKDFSDSAAFDGLGLIDVT